MEGPADESVGAEFSDALLQAARDKTLTVIEEAARRVRPGMTEADVKMMIQDIQTQMGASRTWHPPQIRFGENTLLPFGKPGQDIALQETDIFFFDIGPVFDGHEGDVGRAFQVGNNPEFTKCCRDVEAIWFEVREHWLQHGVSGEELYQFAEKCAEARGWRLSLQKANGHRIADFPHAARARGSVQGFTDTPAPNRWILEIQIRHPEKNFGAFYEDLLN